MGRSGIRSYQIIYVRHLEQDHRARAQPQLAARRQPLPIPPIPTEEIERLLSESAPRIWRHSAIISLGNNQAFSGVFAKSFGYEGILTAGHSAEQFLAKEHVALAVSEVSHRLIVDSKDFDHVRIGYDECEGYASGQPDLSFVIIRNKELLQLLRKGYKVRCITGHAWVSIYGHVRRVLAGKRAAEELLTA